jgi:hypothetical protein
MSKGTAMVSSRQKTAARTFLSIILKLKAAMITQRLMTVRQLSLKLVRARKGLVQTM